MNINSLNYYNNLNMTNRANAPIKKSSQIGTSNCTSNVLSTQLQGKKQTENIQYLNYDLSKKEIIDALNDKNKMGRSFFGYKSAIANTIIKADDKKLAVDNFNILMNTKNKKINARDITNLLYISTIINNKNTKISEKFAEEYGFKGGLLDDKSIDSILNKISETMQLLAIQNQILQDQMMQDQMMMEDQMMEDQMLQNQMMQNQMMMMTPGMGFC